MFYLPSSNTPKTSPIRERNPSRRLSMKGIEKLKKLVKRDYIHHPSDIPIIYRRMACVHASTKRFVDNAFVGLSFYGRDAVKPGNILGVVVSTCTESYTFQGKVVWIHYLDSCYRIGMCFANEEDAFRVRMIEQVCHIEVYRRRLCVMDGRAIDTECAAQEWIERFSAQFPKLSRRP